MLFIGIALFFAAVYFLLSGLTVQQREIAVSVRKAIPRRSAVPSAKGSLVG